MLEMMTCRSRFGQKKDKLTLGLAKRALLLSLQPLCEIAPHKQHPVYQKSTQALLDTCEDNTPLSIHELVI